MYVETKGKFQSVFWATNGLQSIEESDVPTNLPVHSSKCCSSLCAFYFFCGLSRPCAGAYCAGVGMCKLSTFSL